MQRRPEEEESERAGQHVNSEGVDMHAVAAKKGTLSAPATLAEDISPTASSAAFGWYKGVFARNKICGE